MLHTLFADLFYEILASDNLFYCLFRFFLISIYTKLK